MPLVLTRVEGDDLLEIAKLERASFANSSPRGMEPFLHPNGTTEAVIKGSHQQHINRFAIPENVYWKVMDTDLNKAISFAMWHIYRQDQPESEWGLPTSTVSDNKSNPDVNMDVWRAFLEAGAGPKRKIIAGRKRVHLSLLCTLPDHQRRGAAKMLLEKGAEIADREQLDSTLSASVTGLPLYRKVGFKEVEGGACELDLRPFGGDEIQVNTIMMRPLEKKNVD